MATGFYGVDHPNPNKSQFNVKRRNPHGAVSGTIVVHTAENIPDFTPPDDGAENVAAYLSRRTTYGSYHDLVDSDSIVRYLPISYEAFHETRTNHWAVGISAAIRTTDWTTASAGFIEAVYRNLARTAANRVIEIKATYGITVPIARISRTDALNRKPGFIGHGDIDTGRRSDPGANFDWNRFFRYVNEALGTKPPTPVYPPAPTPSTQLKVDGYNGPKSVTRYQQIAGTSADGVISSPSEFTRWLQGFLNTRGFRDYEGKALVVDGYGFRTNDGVAVTTRTRTDYALQQYLETLPSGRNMALLPGGAKGQYVGDGTWSSPSYGAKIMQFEANAGRLFR
jgi:hypothetical protein